MAEHRWDTEPSAADDPGTRLPIRRRWQLSFRAAVLAVSLLLGTAAAFAVFRGGDDIEVSSVELDPPQAGDAPSTGGGHSGSPVPGDVAGEAVGTPTGSAAGNNSSSGNETPAVVPAVLVVHIAGAVMHPGVVRVPAGSRTVDAVDAAGGAAPDADLAAVNLAAALQDGAMVLVPRIGDPPRPVSAAQPPDGGLGSGTGRGTGTGTEAGTGAGSTAGALINLNTASVQELDTLPRVGPVIAERIVAWRQAHGAFSRPEDLDAVPGIGETMLAALLPLITV